MFVDTTKFVYSSAELVYKMQTMSFHRSSEWFTAGVCVLHVSVAKMLLKRTGQENLK